MIKRYLGAAAVMAALLFPKASAQSLEETFRTPPEEAKPLMIWQWMDGMVTREGITADLEAYKAAGIGGVQQFLVGGDAGSRYVLDLGDVKNLAVVRVNGTALPTLWRTPFRVDVTGLLRKGENVLEIDVTNLWLNRLAGDEREPDDIRWAEPTRMGGGSFMLEVPEWLRSGSARPSQGRKAVVSYKVIRKDTPLLPSGLIGPTVLLQVEK